MKKTEAISILATSVRPREAKDRARYDEAVRIAIEALKCSETPKSSERAVEATQPDHNADIGKKVADDDCISRQMAIDALQKEINKGIPPFDDVMGSIRCGVRLARNIIEDLPLAAPSTAQTTETTAPSTDDWIPVEKRLPAVPWCRCLITRDDGRGRATVEEALFSFGRWYSNEWLEDGRNREFDISTSVIAWAPFPAPYRGGDT